MIKHGFGMKAKPLSYGKKTGGNGIRRAMTRMAVSGIIFLFLTQPLMAFAAEGDTTAPKETVLYRNGTWDTAYWGDEGRLAYRYSGNTQSTVKTNEDAFEITLSIDSPTLVRSVVTVHKNNEDQDATTLKSVINGEAGILDASWPKTEGEVAITDEDGNIYGPFPCKIESPPVVNGEVQPYALWSADTGELELEPGKYSVLGSLPGTLIMNDETGDEPAILIKGVDAEKWQNYLESAGDSRGFQGSYRVEVRDESGSVASEPVGFGMIDKGGSVEIVGMVADMPIDQSLPILSRSKDTIEAGGSVSLLPDQGLFDLSIEATISLDNNEWVFSGDWTFIQSIGGDTYKSESTFQGRMISRDLPGFFFPAPAAGLGSLGSIPGPASETQAVAGIIAPGLLALIASALANGKTGGGSGGTAVLFRPSGPAAPGSDTVLFQPSGPAAQGSDAVLFRPSGPAAPGNDAVFSPSALRNLPAGTGDIPGQGRNHIPGVIDDLLKGKREMVQANADFKQIHNLMPVQPSAGSDAVSESIQKAIGQVVDTSNGNVLDGVGIQVANDVATGGLADFGFSGGDMLKAAARSIDADDVIPGTIVQISALNFAQDESRQLCGKGLDILSPLFKPRTNIPGDLIQSARNTAFPM